MDFIRGNRAEHEISSVTEDVGSDGHNYEDIDAQKLLK
jgi:hypothetical protein